MTPEEKNIERMRRNIPRTRTTVIVIAFGMCVILVSYVSIVIWDAQLENTHRDIREHTNQSVLSDLLAEQSRLEMAISLQLSMVLTFAIFFGLVVGRFTFGTRLTRLTLAMWDKIQRLEARVRERDREPYRESDDSTNA